MVSMSKKELYQTKLQKILDSFIKSGKSEILEDFLISNSNLPGPRANLELSEAFSKSIAGACQEDMAKLWQLCVKFTSYSADEAPANSPKEFLVLCGARAVGTLGRFPNYFDKSLSFLRQLASDPRWRTREGVATALQDLIETQPQKTIEKLEAWVKNDDWLAMRAVAAGVAEPRLLKNKGTAMSALELHKRIIQRIISEKNRDADFKTLKQALGYSISVVVSEAPDDGFAYMHRLAESDDEDILWIIRENLKKARLTKKFPEEVNLLVQSLKDKS